jgi:hypothetical protein
MRVGLVAVVVVAFVVSGCTQSAPPANSPAVPVFSTAPAAAGKERTVPDNCDAIASLDDLSRILDNYVAGPVQPIVGVAQDNIGRTARIDCYYSVPAGQPATAAYIWIGLASYVNAESARKRLTATVATEREQGTTVSVNDVKVGQDRGVLIRNANWMLVAARGPITVVVQVIPALVREDHAGALLGQVADFALTSH